jgi:hypothetical protein
MVKAFPEGVQGLDAETDEMMSSLAIGSASPEQQAEAFLMITETVLFMHSLGLIEKLQALSGMFLRKLAMVALGRARELVKKSLN